ncbi:ABC transporter ATP-binding protein [Curtanaerobium respiraculi]|uniref:ABC transporter ATP-binding protein n=1 Tax=Curtanaerobium respiraculi TaxID=2949669 RepID=UPI003D17A8CC
MTTSEELKQEQQRRRQHRAPTRGPSSMVAGEKPRDLKGSMRSLVRFLSPHKAGLAFVVVFALASTVFNVIGPKVLSLATTEVFDGSVAAAQGAGGIDFGAVASILIGALALYAVSSACAFGQGWIMSGIAQRVCYDMRRQIDLKIDRMPLGYFERSSTGDVLSRITNDVDLLGQSLNQGLTQLVTSLVTIVGVLIMMLLISPVLTLIALVIVPLTALLLRVVVKRSQGYFKAQQAMLGAIDGQVEETFSGHEVVKAFNGEARALDEFDRANGKLYESAWKSQFISGLMMPAMNLISNLGYVATAVAGAMLAVRGSITVGDIQAFIQYVKNFTQPIQELAQVANVLQSMAAAAERVFEFLEEDEIEDAPARADASDVEGRVEFEHVRFGYDPDHPVIKDFSATVEPGQTVALVGPTGAGKTTMVKLLMRFYDVQGGSIRLDGHDLREYDRFALRSCVGMVLQDTWLFSGTIRDNIRYGNPDATDEEVEAAARAAHAHHFICTEPGGYDMELAEDAGNLSAGQRQLITIARAFLSDRRMLVLDEATSSVDTRTERQIQAAMDALMRDRTSFVIAHRLSTIRNADLILCIDHGDIVEQGTHEELMALGGFYSKLYNSQFVCEEEG